MTCNDCKSAPADQQMGECDSCHASTSSKSFRLCVGCGKMYNKCRRCKQPLRQGLTSTPSPSGIIGGGTPWLL